jgi:FkbM family methyltransferase
LINFRKAISEQLTFVGYKFQGLACKIYNPNKQHLKNIDTWQKLNGDKTLRLDYPEISPTDIVFDMGGFEGQWSSDIFSRYCCNIYIFEPVQEFAKNIANRFSRNEKIEVFPYGLGEETCQKKIAVSSSSSSIVREIANADYQTAQIICASDFLNEHKINQITLMKINIEGGEYGLLEHLIRTRWIVKITNIQVQFHNFDSSCQSRMERIQQDLSKTHFTTYKIPFVWENWKKY